MAIGKQNEINEITRGLARRQFSILKIQLKPDGKLLEIDFNVIPTSSINESTLKRKKKYT